METKEKRLLELVQLRFPLTPFPFRSLGEEVGLGEAECLELLRRLKAEGVVRQVGAIFESRALGYRSALVALKLAPQDLDGAAAVINAHPGVSHNYAREHPFNLWFTLSLPRSEDMAARVREMAAQAGAEEYLFLPTLKVFKISAFFPLGQGLTAQAPRPLAPRPARLSPAERRGAGLLQQDLPLVPRPFAELANGSGMGEGELLEMARRLLERGVMRRYSAHLHHRRLGFAENALGCWAVPASRVEEAGRMMATSPRVTHCYRRPVRPNWPYRLYTMVHAPTRQECQEIAAGLARDTGVKDYLLLFSTREYKKERVSYFA